MLRRVALVRTDVSEELSASIIRVTRLGELGMTLAVYILLSETLQYTILRRTVKAFRSSNYVADWQTWTPHDAFLSLTSQRTPTINDMCVYVCVWHCAPDIIRNLNVVWRLDIQQHVRVCILVQWFSLHTLQCLYYTSLQAGPAEVYVRPFLSFPLMFPIHISLPEMN
jgi:hypothetical protein